MTDPASCLTTPSQTGRSNAAAPSGTGDPARTGRFGAALRQMALAGSLTPAGTAAITVPAETDPSVSDAGDGAQPVPDDAQPSRLTARKLRGSSDRRHDKNSTGGDQSDATDAPDAAPEIPSQPLTIASLNDLLLFADPAVLSLRGIQLPGAGPVVSPPPAVCEEPKASTSDSPTNTSAGSRGIPEPSEPESADSLSRTPPSQPATAAPQMASRTNAAPLTGDHLPPQSSGVKAIDTPSRASSAASSQPLTPPTDSTPSIIPELPRVQPSSAGTKPAIDGIRTAGPTSTGPRLFQVRPQTSAAQPADSADESPFSAQVSRGLAAAMAQQPDDSGDGPRSVTLRLQPESLGKIRIDLGVDGQAVTARFEAATPEARDLLVSSLATLRSSLEERGLNVQHLHVTLASSDAAPRAIAGLPPNEPPQSPAWNAGHQPSTSDWSGAGQSQSNDRQSRSEGGAERRQDPAVEPLAGPVGGADRASLFAQPHRPGPLGGAAAYGTRAPRSLDPGASEVTLLLGIDTIA